VPRVSVITPTHNRRDFIREAIASVLAQTYQNFEIIVVDDGSDDDTHSVVEEFSHAYPVVQYILQSNQGVSAARNYGVTLSCGQFVAFLDSDDVWQPSKLESQVAFFTAHPEAAICQTEEIWLRNGVRVNPHHKHRKASGDIFARSLELCLVSPSAVMLRRALFDQMGGFDPDLPTCEDYDLWLRIAALMPIHLIDSPLVIKRGGHSDQLSHRFWGMDRFRVTALHKLLDSGVLSDEQRQLSLTVLRKKCAILVQGARKRGKTGEEYVQLAACYAGET
jgi:glycosyltransferase involved in cell wall biosynthesis